MYTFGTQKDPAQYVEIPDPANPGQVIRPDAGTTLLVRDAATLADLTPTTSLTYGYFAWTDDTDTHPQILVSGDGGTTWVGPLDAAEARTKALNAGVDASSALVAANGAVATASAAQTATTALDGRVTQLEQNGGGGTTFTGHVDWVTQVDNKPTIPTTAGQVGAVAATAVGVAGGVAGLDSGAKVPVGQLPVGSGAGQVAAGAHTHSVPIDWLPPGSTITVTAAASGTYPVRPTNRTDVVVIWRGPNPPASGGTGAVANVDEWRNRVTA